MFHQANVVPTTTLLEGEEEMSMLEFWYHVVLEELSQYINIKGDASSSFGVKVGTCASSLCPSSARTACYSTQNMSLISVAW